MAARKNSRGTGRASGQRRPRSGTVRPPRQKSELEVTVAAVARVLKQLKDPAAIIGGIAVVSFGHDRSTSDVDCAIAAPVAEAPRILKVFQRGGFMPRYGDVLARVEDSFLLPLTHTETGITVDASLAQLRFEREALSDPVIASFNSVKIPVPHVTDLLIYKLAAGRPQDLLDARRLLVLGHHVDRERVEETLREFDELLDTDQAGEWRRLLASLE